MTRLLSFLTMIVVLTASSLSQDSLFIRENFTKHEYQIPMRDGVKLFTSVYVPKDASEKHPILLTRTPYSVGPYGIDAYRASLGPSEHFQNEGFIFVHQDARGRYMSEGVFAQVRPHVPVKRGPQDVDESSDMYDTIPWLLANVAGTSGRVGGIGISYPGWLATMTALSGHPALRAVSPQAPMTDTWIGDDFFHNGAFRLSYGVQGTGPDPYRRGG